jgi:hypothetical protein
MISGPRQMHPVAATRAAITIRRTRLFSFYLFAIMPLATERALGYV